MLVNYPFITPELLSSRMIRLIRQQMVPKLKLRYTISPKLVYDCLNLQIKEMNTRDADEIRKVKGGTLELTTDAVALVAVPLLLVEFELELEEMHENEVEL